MHLIHLICFLRRVIHDQILIEHGLHNGMHRHDEATILLKLDLCDTYDRVTCFLRMVPRYLNLHFKWIDLILQFVPITAQPVVINWGVIRFFDV